MKKILSFMLCLCMILSLAACSSSETPAATEPSQKAEAPAATSPAASANAPSEAPAETYSLKFGHVLAANAPESEIWQWFADEVNSRTSGGVEIIVYPNEELGSAAVQVESLKVGTIDLFCQGTTVFSGPTGITTFNISSTPFLFGDSELYQTAMANSGLNDEQARQMNEAGLHIVNTERNFFRGARVLCSTKPIDSVEDLEGLRFRAYESDSYVGAYSALGANPLIVAWSETFSALQNGTVEAASSSVDQVASAMLHEVAPHMTWTYEYNTDVVLAANLNSWKKLPAEYQEIITQVANEAGDKMAESVAASTDEMVNELINEHGCTFYDIDTAALRAKLADFYEELANNGTIPASVLEYVL